MKVNPGWQVWEATNNQLESWAHTRLKTSMVFASPYLPLTELTREHIPEKIWKQPWTSEVHSKFSSASKVYSEAQG